ncbi:hypothetical protein [Rhizobium etli]|uniref:hypothetical protein n=1 Tax=Rhizobium etli TaxID=29449 RepID=UPI0012DAFEF6|nr:hypothetical protein [Rhizobium etli]
MTEAPSLLVGAGHLQPCLRELGEAERSEDRFEQVFLLAIREGQVEPAQWADYVWSVPSPQGQRLLKNGRTLDLPEENVAELNRRAQDFSTLRLPVCRNLGIIL